MPKVWKLMWADARAVIYFHIPLPAKLHGPCGGPCEHLICAGMRQIAASDCPICFHPIGFERNFYRQWDGRFVHASCADDQSQGDY